MITEQCKCGFSAQGNFCSNCGTLRQSRIFQFVEEGSYSQLEKALKEYSYDLEAKDDEGYTALILTAKKGHKNCLKVLLEHEADPDAKNNDGTTGLMWTVINGWKECLQLLLEDAFLDAINDHGGTAVFFAVKFNQKECLQILLEHGADPNIGEGESTLTFAAIEGNKEILEALLKYGATPSPELKRQFPQYADLWKPDIKDLLEIVAKMKQQVELLEEKIGVLQ